MNEFVPEAPAPDDVTGPWWDSTRDRRLVLQHCSHCDIYQHPPRALCTTCGDLESLEFRDSPGEAVIDSWTIVHRSPIPSTPVPYVIARVHLAEGPLLLTRLVDGSDWRIGEPVVLEWIPMADGRALPVFRREGV